VFEVDLLRKRKKNFFILREKNKREGKEKEKERENENDPDKKRTYET